MLRIHRLRIHSALALTACVWLGCDSSATAPAATNPDPNAGRTLISACGLVTQAEAEAIIGKPVLSMKEDTSGGTASLGAKYITNCAILSSLEPGAILPTRLSVTAFTTGGLQPLFHLTVPVYFANLKTATSAATRDSVADVGAEAFWQKRPGKLSLYKQDVYADISYSLTGKVIDTSASAKAACIAAGMKAAEKI